MPAGYFVSTAIGSGSDLSFLHEHIPTAINAKPINLDHQTIFECTISSNFRSYSVTGTSKSISPAVIVTVVGIPPVTIAEIDVSKAVMYI
ncbi:MAG: hypothetical protein BWY67_01462 [Bacteroidetes bacterium ADurb.Bin397]|nr:MAG: hypothetical protein BWY67_01462 [Bacteroidetes bacterium ADurb.Bin397]